MDTNSVQAGGDTPSVRELARALDCIEDVELQALAKVKASTTEAWRKRGKGPAYIVFGNAILYPREAVAEYLKTLLRERRPGASARALL
jgi:hypothetical protein